MTSRANRFVHAVGIAVAAGITFGTIIAGSSEGAIRSESTTEVLAERIQARTCFGRTVTINESGPVILGTTRRDVINGGRGDDTIFGFDGSDFLCGGRGDDHIIGGPQHDRADGGRGRDLCDSETRRRCP